MSTWVTLPKVSKALGMTSGDFNLRIDSDTRYEDGKGYFLKCPHCDFLAHELLWYYATNLGGCTTVTTVDRPGVWVECPRCGREPVIEKLTVYETTTLLHATITLLKAKAKASWEHMWEFCVDNCLHGPLESSHLGVNPPYHLPKDIKLWVVCLPEGETEEEEVVKYERSYFGKE